jgi:hypothetical protein
VTDKNNASASGLARRRRCCRCRVQVCRRCQETPAGRAPLVLVLAAGYGCGSGMARTSTHPAPAPAPAPHPHPHPLVAAGRVPGALLRW